MWFRLAIGLVVALTAACATNRAPGLTPDVQPEFSGLLYGLVSCEPGSCAARQREQDSSYLDAFYQRQANRPRWLTGLGRAATALEGDSTGLAIWEIQEQRQLRVMQTLFLYAAAVAARVDTREMSWGHGAQVVLDFKARVLYEDARLLHEMEKTNQLKRFHCTTTYSITGDADTNCR